MMVNGSSIATPLNFAPIVRYRSYWAGHFFSVLRCLRYHNGLEYPGRKMLNFGVEDWSLSELRGSAPPDFFGKINQYMNNWGFQYLLVSLLNSRPAFPVVEALIGEIERLWSVTFDKTFSNYEFKISGKDSDLSAGLGLLFTKVFPDNNQLTPAQKQDVIDDSDLCLLLTKPEALERKGIFGEVEGLKGSKILLDSFWKKKSNHCVYAFGVNKEQGNVVDYQVRFIDGLYRVLITFQSGNFVVQDFQATLWWFHYLFQNGPFRKALIPDEETGYFYNILQMNWNKPISEVLAIIEEHMWNDDVVIATPGASPIITSLLSK